MKRMLLTTAATAVLVSTAALAQDAVPADPTIEPPTAPAPRFSSIQEMTVGDVLGMIAYDPDGNKIGEIDYVITPASGPMAVIGIGGFIGLGEYTVALPLDEFKLSPDARYFTLQTDKATLKSQPEFDESTALGLPRDRMIAEIMSGQPTEEMVDVKPTAAPGTASELPVSD